MTKLDEVLTDFVVVYKYNVIDKFDKQQYVFKVNHEASLKKLSSFLKPKRKHENKFYV